MFGLFSKNKKKLLAEKCQAYLDAGPPQHMSGYVPESLTEIIIAHGAQQKALDAELQEVASIILIEAEDLSSIEDAEVREYLMTGAQLVEAVLNR